MHVIQLDNKMLSYWGKDWNLRVAVVSYLLCLDNNTLNRSIIVPMEFKCMHVYALKFEI